MKLTIDGNEILKDLAKKPDRKRRTFYVSESLYKDFQKECEETPPSQVVEALMRIFVDSRRGGKGK
jgi:hypothetical protein